MWLEPDGRKCLNFKRTLAVVIDTIFQQSKEAAVEMDGAAIRLIPAWKWLLDFNP